MPTKTHTKAAARRSRKPANNASSGHEAPHTARSSLTQGDVEVLTVYLKDIQRLVRVCYAAGDHETEEFKQEIADTLGEEVLGYLWKALEVLEKTPASEPGGAA
jgi:hypothetical protein